MAKESLGELTAVDLREVWEDEARDFTPWLARPENIAALSRQLGDLELEVEGVEVDRRSQPGCGAVEDRRHLAGRSVVADNILVGQIDAVDNLGRLGAEENTERLTVTGGAGFVNAIVVAAGDGQRLVSRVDHRPHAVDPVSYTHLRAHEPVLDLVCRLLLAQNKTKATKHTPQLIISIVRNR